MSLVSLRKFVGIVIATVCSTIRLLLSLYLLLLSLLLIVLSIGRIFILTSVKSMLSIIRILTFQ